MDTYKRTAYRTWQRVQEAIVENSSYGSVAGDWTFRSACSQGRVDAKRPLFERSRCEQETVNVGPEGLENSVSSWAVPTLICVSGLSARLEQEASSQEELLGHVVTPVSLLLFLVVS